MIDYNKNLQELKEQAKVIADEILKIEELRYAELNSNFVELVGKYYLQKVEPTRWEDTDDINSIHIFKIDSLTAKGEFLCSGYGVYSYNSCNGMKIQISDKEILDSCYTEITEEEYNIHSKLIRDINIAHEVADKLCNDLFIELLNHN